MAMEDSNGWQTVSNPKRNRRQSKPPHNSAATAAAANGAPDVFLSVEQHAQDRLRALSASAAAQKLPPDEEIRDLSGEDPEEAAGAAEDVQKEVKKAKQKKPKQPKISVPEAASKMDASDLAAHLAELSENYGEDLQLMRFGDYFGRAFSAVGSAQFPWVKMFRESPVAKLVDVPISHVKDDVLRTAVAWLRKKSPDALATFVLSSLDSILDDLSIHLGTAKGSKKPAHAAPSKSQVAVFIVLAMALRGKPEVLINILPILRENSKYQGQEKLPLMIWMATQASQGDLTVGMYMWANYLLPVLSTKSGNNPLCRDLVLQLVERILSFPKARPVLLNGAVRKGERLVPPQALELLMGFTFPAPSDRVKATERFEAIYPTLKEIALTGTGGRGMKLVVQQIAGFTIKGASEGGDDLSAEAAKIFLWCLDENPDSYSHWDKLYLDNLKGSVIIMRKLSDEWKIHMKKATEHDSLQKLRTTLSNFIQKNEKALETEKDAARCALLKDANECCKVLLSKAKKSKGYVKTVLLLSVCCAVGAVVVSQNMEHWDMQKISEKLGDLTGWDMDELPRMFAKVAKMLNLPVTD